MTYSRSSPDLRATHPIARVLGDRLGRVVAPADELLSASEISAATGGVVKPLACSLWLRRGLLPTVELVEGSRVTRYARAGDVGAFLAARAAQPGRLPRLSFGGEL